MSFDLNSLNEEQLLPVLQTEGAVLVTAGAGSGKTRLLTHRIAHLIENKGVSPYNILAITFTNKAAREIQMRVDSMLGCPNNVWVSTFHSMCAKILRFNIKSLGYTSDFSIYSESEKERTIKKLLKEGDDTAETDDEKSLIKQIAHAISDAKNDGIEPDEYYKINQFMDNADIIHKIYTKYEKELKNNNALDFDDLLYKTYTLLKTDEKAREYYADKFKYIHVDEFQDTNNIQYRLVRLLSLKHKNVLVVGDEDQSIYGWRGANISNIRDFTQDFADCKIYKLEQNYRSTKTILNLANKLIENNTSRIKKTLWTENVDGEEVETFAAPTETAEAEYVVKNINHLVTDEHYRYSDIAVLIRLNALTRSFEEKFMQYGIPYKVYGGFKFYERKEIKDILAYLRIIVNPSDAEAITRVINFPKRGIGDKAIAQLVNYCAATNKTLFEAIYYIDENQDLPPALVKKILPFSATLKCLIDQSAELKISELVKYLIRLINLKEEYKADTEENETRKRNIEELVGSIQQFESLNKDAGLNEYLQNVTLYSDLDEMDDDTSAVSIITVHSAKGLEFDAIFVAGLEEGIFPAKRSLESTAEIEEERRLMYVAITRARKQLYITYSATRFLYGERKPSVKSRFIEELGFVIEPPKYGPGSNYGGYREGGYENRYGNNYGSGYNNSYGNNYGNNSYKKSYVDTSYTKNNTQNTTSYKPQKQEPVLTKNTNIDLAKFNVGTKVRHKKFGDGIILNISNEGENSYAEIEFENGLKLMLAVYYAPLEVI